FLTFMRCVLEMGGRRIAEEGRKQKAEGRNGAVRLLTHRLHHRLTRPAEHFCLLPSAFRMKNSLCRMLRKLLAVVTTLPSPSRRFMRLRHKKRPEVLAVMRLSVTIRR